MNSDLYIGVLVLPSPVERGSYPASLPAVRHLERIGSISLDSWLLFCWQNTSGN